MQPTTRQLAAAAALMAATLSAHAADTPTPPGGPPAATRAAAADALGPAREKVAAKEWAAAVDALMLVRNDSNADWHNLMGLALRNLPAADFAVAEFHYAEALRINPAHRGAMEYLGELYLQTGRRAQAEAQLAALARACPAGCPELSDLKAALAKARP
jgi:tetratricopeptide (TPR) repeat protein